MLASTYRPWTSGAYGYGGYGAGLGYSGLHGGYSGAGR